MERTLRSYLVPSLLYALLLEAMIAAAILYWPDFEDNIDAYGDILPFESVRKMVDSIADTGVSAYVNLQHFYKACNVLGTAAAVFFAVGAVAGEANRGTLELWLSRPVSRTRMLLERYIAGALAMILPIFLTSATIPWLLEQVGEEMSLSGLMLSSAHESLFLLVLYSLAFCLSTISSRPMPIALGLLFVTIFQFSIYLVMEWTHYSWFRLADLDDFQTILRTGELDLSICGPLAIANAVLLGLSLFLFHRRVP